MFVWYSDKNRSFGMDKIDAFKTARLRILRHVAKLYFPNESFLIAPRLPDDASIQEFLNRLHHDILFGAYTLAIKLDSLLYSCDILESEYLYHHKVPPFLSEELEELYSLYERTKGALNDMKRRHLDIFLLE